jgi:hypothetical protein
VRNNFLSRQPLKDYTHNSFSILKDFNMKIDFPRNIGLLLLAIYLILVGITALIPGLAIPSIVYGILALISGIFILIGR